MSDALPPPDCDMATTTTWQSGVLAWVAWVVVVLVVVWRGLVPALMPASPPEPAEQAQQESGLVDMVMEFQGRVMLAADQLARIQEEHVLAAQLAKLEVGSVGQRQRIVALTGIIRGRQAGMEALRRLQVQARDAGVQLTPAQLDTNRTLTQAFAPINAVLSQADRDQLIESLGWFGKATIAETQPGEENQLAALHAAAMTLLVILIVVMAAGGLVALAGLAGLIVGLVLAVRRILRPLSICSSPSGVFVETFAAWLVVFLVLAMVAGTTGTGLAGTIVGFWLSLIVLAWLPIRGVSWSTALAELGLTRGRGFWREFGAGFAGYAMMLPILCLGVLATLGLLKLSQLFSGSGESSFQTDSGPTHPIFEIVASGSVGQLVLVYLVAAITAPVVEEIMFRGVLYRHLRGGTWHWSTWLSVIFSAFISAFIFAAIHPQGWVAIPALGSIGVALALAREWRSSLIAPMIMHGINNGLVLTLFIVILG